MKKDLDKQLEQFSSIFDNFPNLSVLHLDNGIDFLKSTIEEVVKKSDGKLIYNDFKDCGGCARFRSSTRDFEYAILSDVIQHCPEQKKMLSLIYRSLENSAQIILVSKKDEIDVDKIKQLLDETNFLAVNDIDIFPQYHLVVAKKMHMWDAGL